MFEVGKKYKLYTGVIRTCVFSNKHGAVLERDDDSSFYKHSFIEYWEEYVEPKMLTRDLFVRTNGSEVWTYDSEPESRSVKTVGRIRVTYTEGQGLAVEVLD